VTVSGDKQDRLRCCSTVVNPGGLWTNKYKQCSRAGVAVRDGQNYCTQHDPEVVRERRDALRAQWDAKRDGEREAKTREQAVVIFVGAVPTDQIQALNASRIDLKFILLACQDALTAFEKKQDGHPDAPSKVRLRMIFKAVTGTTPQTSEAVDHGVEPRGPQA
jgi:hypothetical protein